MLRAICLDLMDTVLVDPYRTALHAGTGIDPAELRPLMDRRAWPDFEAAVIDEATFAARFFVDPHAGRALDLAAFTRARQEGYRWVPGMRELVESLGGILDRWVASNYPVWIEELRAAFGLDERFEGVLASSHVGVRKPDPAFFAHLLDAVGHPPEACLFVDDRAANCDAARAAGMRAHVFTDAAGLAARLRAEGVALPDLQPGARRGAGWGGGQVWQTPQGRDDERGDMARHRVAVIGGDGIGPEVTAEAVKVLEAALAGTGSTVATTPYDLGGRRYLATGEVLPDTVLDELRGHDAILLGAIGTPEVPPGVLERGLLLALRFAFDQYVNLRPVKLLPGVVSPIAGLTPDRCDLVVVRENTEGPYAGAGGVLYRGTPAEVATQESLNTRYGVERVVRYAAERAAARSGRLTLCHKTNVLAYAGDLWQRTVDAVVAEHPGVVADYVHVDALCLYLVTQPDRFDVVVTDNLFGDIVTDLGAAVQGGLGYAASGNLDPTRRAPSMFEPVHGSAPDIAGTGRASPVAAVLSAALCLDHLGEHRAAAAVEAAVARVVAEFAAPGAGGCAYSTAQIGDRIAAALA